MRHYDSTKEARYPEYAIRVYVVDPLLAAHETMDFEQVFTNPQNT